MNTFIYMVRHCESIKAGGDERNRGLTDKGKLDVIRVTELLRNTEIIHLFQAHIKEQG